MRDTHQLAAALEQRLSLVLESPVKVSEIEAVTAGASKSIWTFVAETGGRRLDLVLRQDPIENQKPEAMAQESAVLRAAGAQGVLAPAVIDSAGIDGGLGSPFVIMTRIFGETIAPRNLRDEQVQKHNAELAADLGQAIAQIQRIPTDSSPTLKRYDDVAMFEEQYRQGALSPAMEIGWRWLRENPTTRRPDVFVHGDFRHGNFIVSQGRLAAVLDWELAHIGDPLEDLGWVTTKAWRFGKAPMVGGFGALSALLDGYEQEAGWRPRDQDVLWWSAFGSIRWGVMCRRQAYRHLSGNEESLELALIGRRFAENEFDVLLALGLAEPVAPFEIIPGDEDPGMFGAPTVDDILQAIIAQTGRSKQYADRILRSGASVVQRELAQGAALSARLRAALDAAGYRNETALATAIREGVELTDTVIAAVRAGVEGRLQVWNPKYLGYPVPPEA